MLSILEIAERNSYVKNLVVVDGIMRTGKSLNNSLIASLDRCEMWQQYPIIDSIPLLHGLGRLDADVAIALLHREIDMNLYYQLVGRKVNFRYADTTGIWRSKDPGEYFRRIFSNEEVEILDRIISGEIDPIFNLCTHDVMCNVNILYRAYPDVRIVWARRHPADAVYSWHMKQWGDRIGTEPRSLALAFKGSDGPIPWFAVEWMEAYTSMSPTDRIIHGIDWLQRRAKEGYDALNESQRSQVFIATFEDVVTNSEDYFDKMCKFLGTNRTSATPAIMERERVPRELTLSDHERRLDTIRKSASSEAFDHLRKMGAAYDQESTNLYGLDIPGMRRS